MKLSIVVAKSDNGVIGVDNGLPWHLPEDLKRFKALTMGHPMIMGRLTYESIGRPLPGRKTIVISSGKPTLPDGVTLVDSLESAELIATQEAQKMGVDELMVVGGANVYSQFIDRVCHLYVTEVHTCIEGDAFFPELDPAVWQETERADYNSESSAAPDYSFVTYVRKQGG